MNFEFIKTANENGIIHITLSRPPHNVLHVPAINELLQAFQWAKTEEGHLILLDAEGDTFSLGVDVGDHQPGKKDDLEAFYQIFEVMFGMEKPIVCAINGYVLGGGCELAICSDLVVASDKVKIGQPEINVGSIAAIATYMLPRLMSWPRAMELLLSGETISAEKAEQFGLVNVVLPAENFSANVKDYLKKYLNQSSLLLAKVKKSMMAAQNKSFPTAMQEVRRIIDEEVLTSHDGTEGLKAFLEKRKPVWLGK